MMKKLIGFLGIVSAILCFSACGMKECKCYSTNVLTQNDSVVGRTTDTVSNFTRGNCEDFNKEEDLQMDSLTIVHHSILCTDN